MRLLASTGPFFARPLDWTLSVIAEAGFDGAELMVNHDPATQTADRVNDAAATEGVAVPVVHGPFLLLTRRVYDTDMTVKAQRSLELAGGIGADLMVAHPSYRWKRAFHRWLLEAADEEAAALGTRVGVENLYPVVLRNRPYRLHRYTEPDHLLPFTNVVLDTSHFGVAEVDINQAYTQLRHRAVHLHVSDYRGRGRDSHAPIGQGVLPLGQFLRTVGADEAAGVGRVGTGDASITLELDCRHLLDDRDALVAFLTHEREKTLALLSGADIAEVLGRPDVVPRTWTRQNTSRDAMKQDGFDEN